MWEVREVEISLGQVRRQSWEVGRQKFWEVKEVEIFLGQVCRQIWEVMEVENFGRLLRENISGGQEGRQTWEVREVGTFRLGRLGNLCVREVWKDWEDGSIGRNFKPVMNVFLKHHATHFFITKYIIKQTGKCGFP
jgi:hypothetical protein